MGEDFKGREYIAVSLFSLAPNLDGALGMWVEEKGESIPIVFRDLSL